MMHKVCNNNYVRVIDLNSKKSDNCETIKGDNGDYNAVKQLIEEVIIGCNKAVPMIVIYDKFHPPGKYNPDHAKKYRSRLKERILSEHGHSLWLLKVDGKSPDIVVSSEGVKSHTILNDKKTVLKQAAMYLKEDIEMCAADISKEELVWPPNAETLKQQETAFPSSLRLPSQANQ